MENNYNAALTASSAVLGSSFVMVVGGIETAVAFGIGVYIAKVIKDSIRHSRLAKREEQDRRAAELIASEPGRLAKEAEDCARSQKEYEESKLKKAEQKKRDEAEALLKANEVRKSALHFCDFDKGYCCPKCGKAWQHSSVEKRPQACNCDKCTGTHFHLNCYGTMPHKAGAYYGNTVIGCQAKFVMLAKDNKDEGRDP